MPVNNLNGNQPPLLPEPSFENKYFKQLIALGTALTLIIAGSILLYYKTRPAEIILPEPKAIVQPITPMIIATEAFKNDGFIPGKYTCDGLDINPALRIADIPDGTVSLALIVDDPDSPSGDWVHWLVWNIGPDTNKIDENSIPDGASQGATDFNANKYGGPCPGSGTHRYEFKLYALNTMLALPTTAKKADLLSAMQGHIITEAKLTGQYSR